MYNEDNKIGAWRERPKGGTPFRRWAKWFNRQRLYATLERRLRANLVRDPDTGCLLWGGPKKQGRYGYLTHGAHRLMWELANGPIPEGMQVLHKCDTPACCEPDHLFLGTQSENMADRFRKGRTRNQHTGKLEARRLPRCPQSGRFTRG